MTPCDFNQEDFCTLEAEYGLKCKSNVQGKCMAKEEDLSEFCECGEAFEDCNCGISWILVPTEKGVVPVTPKNYKKLVEEARQK